MASNYLSWLIELACTWMLGMGIGALAWYWNYTLSDGQIFGQVGDWIARRLPKMANGLGMCPYCAVFWMLLAGAVIVPLVATWWIVALAGALWIITGLNARYHSID